MSQRASPEPVFLNTAALNEDIKVLNGWDKFDQLPSGLIILLVSPLTLFTKQFGIKKLVEDIFNSNMREDTIPLLLGISQKLDLLELYDELDQLYQEINNHIDCSSDDRVLLLIRGLKHDKNNFQHFTQVKDYTIESTNENLLLSMGKLLIDREHYTDSMSYFDKCLKIRERNNASPDEIAQCYGLLGVSASGKKDFELAYDFTLKAKSKYDLMESISRASIQTISNLGELCKALKKHKEAETYLHLALYELKKYFGIKSFENLDIYNKLGLFYKELKNYNLSIEYFQNYLNLSIELNSKDNESQSLAEIGAVYFEMKIYEKAIEYFKRGFLKFSKYSFLKWEADCYLQLQDFNKALKLYLLVLENWQKKYGTDDSDVIELMNLIKSLKL
jgi:tetratricopeptide (TPR) repeat protein